MYENRPPLQALKNSMVLFTIRVMNMKHIYTRMSSLTNTYSTYKRINKHPNKDTVRKVTPTLCQCNDPRDMCICPCPPMREQIYFRIYIYIDKL